MMESGSDLLTRDPQDSPSDTGGGGAEHPESRRTSAFPSSLAWDSDSEREPLDEDLQLFSNPHGLAALSPAHTSSGHQRDTPEALGSEQVGPEIITASRLEEEERQDDAVCPEAEKYQIKVEAEQVNHTPTFWREEQDVYSFTEDSEGETPPPAPWAHCTFIQRRRRTTAILKPFCGSGEAPGTTSTAVEEPGGGEAPRQIFTCVECSIYFQRRGHLQEHMRQHGPREAWSGELECEECGQMFAEELQLAHHHRRHRESRLKILQEIGKLRGAGERGDAGAPVDCETSAERKSSRKGPAVSLSRRYPIRASKQLPNPTTGEGADQKVPQARCAVGKKCPTRSSRRKSKRGRVRARLGPKSLLSTVRSHARASASASGPEDDPSPSEMRPHDPDVSGSSPKISTRTEAKDEESEVESDRRLVSAEVEDEEDYDVVQHLLGALTEEADEDDGEDFSRSVERRCPYCSDRFHNGIGLANHIRGHLNRVGVSYNVRHFISPEEVNAIEKKFSYQKKKKKVANFDPSTFSVMRCEFCSAGFDTRAGLSSHARAHLRDFGITNWEVTVSPINVLRQLFAEHPDLVLPPASAHEEPEENIADLKLKPEHSPSEAKGEDEAEDEEEEKTPTALPDTSSTSPGDSETFFLTDPRPDAQDTPPQRFHLFRCECCDALFDTRRGLSSHARSHLRQAPPSAPPSPLVKSRSPSPVLRKAPISSLLPVSSPRRTHELKPAHRSSPATPFWAPQESDAPLNLTMDVDTKDIICQLCGAWFETRKGLSSHARAHLRHFGIEYSESKGSPIDLLNRFILTDDFKHKASTFLSDRSTSAKRAPSSTQLHKAAKAPSPAFLGPPAKKPKPSALQLLRLSGGELMSFPVEPLKDVGCEFCGELFENRKGLSSHARSHLRQLGITEWSVNGSPIDTLREIIVRRGLPSITPVRSPRPPAPPFCSAVRNMSPSTSTTSSSSPAVELIQPKPEPETVEISRPAFTCSGHAYPVHMGVRVQDKEPSRDIRCEFCGEFFENRKGLSSHARSHLRHMGITEWSVNGSPIDTLWEVMRRQAPPSVPVKEEPGEGGGVSLSGAAYHFARKSPLDLLHSGSRLHKHGLGGAGLKKRACLGEESRSLSSPAQDLKGKVPAEKHGAGHVEASCELCGFYFENRKALASHARAHLRQFGVTEWCVNGSPIETLSAWIRSRPQKAAQMKQSYAQGARYGQKKRLGSALSMCHAPELFSPAQKPPLARWTTVSSPQKRAVHPDARRASWGLTKGRSLTPAAPPTSQRPNPAPPHAQVARSELNVRLPRGAERRPLKHPSHADAAERDPPKPRTSTVPALVPKPPTTPLVRLVGKIYSLKCRFCEVEFTGPLSVQEDWIRHLQQHILTLNYSTSSAHTPGHAPTASAEPVSPPGT